MTYLVSVTRLRIRAARFLPHFALHTFRARQQVRAAEGFHGGALLLDRRRTFWTMTVWDSLEAMRAYTTSGAHRSAMPRLAGWCDEASVVHWEQPDSALASWAEAARRMRDTGRPSKVRHPSHGHDTLAFAEPRAATGGRISPNGT